MPSKRKILFRLCPICGYGFKPGLDRIDTKICKECEHRVSYKKFDTIMTKMYLKKKKLKKSRNVK